MRTAEDQNVGSAVEHLDDLNGLLFGDGHLIYLLIRVDDKAVFFGNGFYLFLGALYVVFLAVVIAENDILRCRKHINELEMLMYHAYAVRKGIVGGAYNDLLAVNEYLTFIRIIYTRDHIHECGLAAAVLAEYGKDLAAVDCHVNIFVGYDAAECLCDADKPYCFCSFHWKPPVISQKLSSKTYLAQRKVCF